MNRFVCARGALPAAALAWRLLVCVAAIWPASVWPQEQVAIQTQRQTQGQTQAQTPAQSPARAPGQALRLRAEPLMAKAPTPASVTVVSIPATDAGALANSAPAEVAPPLRLSSGRSQVVRVETDIVRIAVGNPDHVDVILITPREVYVLGKKAGATNVFMWGKGGKTTLMEVTVGIDTAALQDALRRLMPHETQLTVSAAGDSYVLTGTLADPVKVQRAVFLAEQFGGRRVINMLASASAAQVMLEVKIAEVSKTVLDRLGARFDATVTGGGNFRYSLITQLLAGAPGAVAVGRAGNALSIDAEIRNGLIKILAEPTIMAVSGQEGTFLAGGKFFIPVPQSGANGASVTLEEKEFGVGLRFTPTVLEGGQINLRVTPEVSELTQAGVPFTSANGTTSVLPSVTTRRVSTTVQLFDGQSFAIGGLVRNNVTETIRRFPGLGEIPVFGALFRSSEFQNDVSELLIIVTPRLVKPLTAMPPLPTDSFIPPSRTEFLLHGQLLGKPKAGQQGPAPEAPAKSQQ